MLPSILKRFVGVVVPVAVLAALASWTGFATLRKASRSIEEVTAEALLRELDYVPAVVFVSYKDASSTGPIPLNVRLNSSISRHSDTLIWKQDVIAERGSGLLGVRIDMGAPIYIDSENVNIKAGYTWGKDSGKSFDFRLNKGMLGWKVTFQDVDRIY